MPIIDMHAHFIPVGLLDEARQGSERFGVHLEDGDPHPWLCHREGFRYPVQREFYDLAAMLSTAERQGLEGRILSVAPSFFHYWYSPAVAADMARLANDFVSEIVRQAPGRLWGMASVPLNDPAAAIRELDRAVQELGLRAVEIGTNVGDVPLSHPELRGFFRRAANLGVPVFLHPYYVGPKPGLGQFYFVNSLGNPMDTALAIAHLIHGGVLAELPELKVITSHGGGFYPYQAGRLDHAWRVRKEPRQQLDRLPREVIGGLYFDSITHDPAALRFLVDQFGAEKVLLGSDFPFDMGPVDCAADVRAAELPAGQASAVLGGNAVKLFGLS